MCMSMVSVVTMMSVVPRCLWWSKVCMVSVVYGAYSFYGVYGVCCGLWCPMVSVLPTVSMMSVVPYGVCSAYVAL